MTHNNVLNAAAAGVRARRRTRLEKLVCAGAHLLQPCQLDADIECMLPCARRAMRGAYRAGARPRARCVVTGLGLTNSLLFCQDQLQVAESTVGRGGALGRLARATL